MFKFDFIVPTSIFFPADIISCVEFNHDGDLLATGDKGGRVVIFQRDPVVSILTLKIILIIIRIPEGKGCLEPYPGLWR